jgi:hypothetical protein
MGPSEIHAAVEALLGEPVRRRSIKQVLSVHTISRNPVPPRQPGSLRDSHYVVVSRSELRAWKANRDAMSSSGDDEG